MNRRTALTALIGLLVGGSAYAADLDMSRAAAIDESSIKIEALDETPSDPGPVIDPSGPVINPPGPVIGPDGPFSPGGTDDGGIIPGGDGGPSIDDIINNIGNIVNIADQVMTIIDKNRPVVDININYANAVPMGTTHWTQLQGWSKPATRKYSLTAKNVKGQSALDVTYQVHWTYGGNLNGRGKFLTGVTIEPLAVTVPWSHKLDMKAEVPESTIVNVGTAQDPVAGMQVQLKWTISSPFSSSTQKVVYYVQGDGLLQEIGQPFTRGAEEKSARQTGELREKMADVKF